MTQPPHPRAVPRKPEGHPTLGKTASNRLRRVDNFLLRYDADVIKRMGGGFDPSLFQAVLPKNYIHRMLPGYRVRQQLKWLSPGYLIWEL